MTRHIIHCIFYDFYHDVNKDIFTLESKRMRKSGQIWIILQ